MLLRRFIVATTAALVALIAAWLSQVEPAIAAPRTETPVYAEPVRTREGTAYRYWVWVTIGDEQPVKAMLDTGSSALLVLSSQLQEPDRLAAKGAIQLSFGAGDTLIGQKTQAPLAVGGSKSSGPVAFGLITAASCVAAKPDCAAAKGDFEHYRIASEGVAGRGFGAILGVALGTSPPPLPLTTALASLAGQWIIELPTPDGGGKPGRLILNPGASDLAGFQIFALDGTARNWNGPLRAGIAGCVRPGSADSSLCGVFGFDCGDSHTLVETADRTLFDSLRKAGTYDFSFGKDSDALTWSAKAPANSFLQQNVSAGRAPLSIVLGYPALWNFAILYDFRRDKVGLKQR